MFFLLFAVALAYIVLGMAVLNRGMAYARTHALLDPQFFAMSVMDRRSLSMTLPKLLFVALWLPTVIAILAFILLRSIFASNAPAATA